MKKLSFITILLFSFISASSQSCLPDGITFTTQSQIDSFQINYPGCTEIEGSVTIGAGISNLNGINILTSIGGTLRIWGNHHLTNLTGLENLTAIGALYIDFSDTLTNLAGLDGLTYIGGSITIIDNFALMNLEGLQGLTTLGGNIQVMGNFSLKNLQGLEGLTSIGGNLRVYDNHSLINFTGLDGLTSIGGYFWVRDNYSLTSFTGLEELTSIGDYFEIEINQNLAGMTGLSGLTSVGSTFEITGNNHWLSLTGLENLTTIGGSLIIGKESFGNPGLTSLAGLEGLTSVGMDLRIVENKHLTNLAGLEGLAIIGGGIDIIENMSLTSISGLDNVDSGPFPYINIYSNDSLTTCETEWLCDYLSNPSGSVNIYSNASGCNNPSEIANSCGYTLPCLPFGNYYILSQADVDNFSSSYSGCTDLEGNLFIEGEDITTLNGLSQVTSVGGSLSIGNYYTPSYGTSVSSMTGFEGLTSIGGFLSISNNDSLTSLTELENLTSIGDFLGIWGNDKLTCLEGLDNIEGASISNLSIWDNPSLSNCEVESICAYLASPGSWTTIYDNAIGCNSPEEVEDACESVSIDEILIGQGISIYPNPAHATITIELPTKPSKYTSLTIYNTNGQQLITQPLIKEQTEIDISRLPSGIYIVKVWNDKEVMVRKVIK